MIRVLIADDQPRIRTGFKTVQHKPDVILPRSATSPTCSASSG